jgi:hypothetical protein
MAKTSIQDKLDRIAHVNGRKVTPYKFIHKNKTQLKTTYNEVYFYFMLVDQSDGSHSVMEWHIRRKQAKTPRNWSRWLSEGYQAGKPGMDIFTENVAPNLSDEHSWMLHEYIGFGVKRALSVAP